MTVAVTTCPPVAGKMKTVLGFLLLAGASAVTVMPACLSAAVIAGLTITDVLRPITVAGAGFDVVADGAVDLVVLDAVPLPAAVALPAAVPLPAAAPLLPVVPLLAVVPLPAVLLAAVLLLPVVALLAVVPLPAAVPPLAVVPLFDSPPHAAASRAAAAIAPTAESRRKMEDIRKGLTYLSEACLAKSATGAFAS